MEPRLLRRGNTHPGQAAAGTGWASMEPRLLRRGNAISKENKETGHPLQWSHAFSDVETWERRQAGTRLRRLQWSHAFSDVETAS